MATACHYINTVNNADIFALKVCFIVNDVDLKQAFDKASVPLIENRKTTASHWNHRETLNSGEVAVEICQDAGGQPYFLVYDNLFRTGKNHAIKQQIQIYSGVLTPIQATQIYNDLLKLDP